MLIARFIRKLSNLAVVEEFPSLNWQLARLGSLCDNCKGLGWIENPLKKLIDIKKTDTKTCSKNIETCSKNKEPISNYRQYIWCEKCNGTGLR